MRNWPEYDRALVQRGSGTLWISDEAIAGWRYERPNHRGAPFFYSDIAIETVLTLREVFLLPHRGAEGFVRSDSPAGSGPYDPFPARPKDGRPSSEAGSGTPASGSG
ncbi:MAG: transposase [Anaerolineae bacterium]|nr:transposase [Anaerolineae bacterium]